MSRIIFRYSLIVLLIYISFASKEAGAEADRLKQVLSSRTLIVEQPCPRDISLELRS